MSRATSLSSHLPHSSTGGRSNTHRHSRWKRILLIAALVVIGLILAVRWIVSPIATAYVNKKISESPDYYGKVGAVKIGLWKVGADLNDVDLYSKDGDGQLPLVHVKKATARFAWSALLRGKLGGEVKAENPEIHIVKTKETPDDGKSAKEKAQEIQAKIDPWREALQRSFPFELTRLEVWNAKFQFIDKTKQPNANIALENVHILATGLKNRKDGEDMPAHLTVDGTTTGNGQVHMEASADPLAKRPRFATNMKIEHMELVPWNSFLKSYANADVSQGSFEFYVEAEAKDGAYQGYVKPFLRDVKFKSTEGNAVERVAKKAANAVVSVLKNDQDEKVATKAPFSGNFDQNNVDVWATIDALLRNAFVQALRSGFEHRAG